MRQIGSTLWPKLRVLQVYGANTGVGKTIFSSILCRAFQKRLPNVYYLKPVSTGPLDEADDYHLTKFGSREIKSNCLFQFDDPVSPHLAVRSAKTPITDEAVVTAVYNELRSYATRQDGISVVETAGGVLSPAPSGITQADLYRPLRLPALLVGDHRLGGIGTTISAWESLHLRGYDVSSVALFTDDYYDNHSYLKQYFADRHVHTFAIPPPPERLPEAEKDEANMRSYYEQSVEHQEVEGFTQRFLAGHDNRISQLHRMPADADKIIWHPFMQHSERSKDTIVAMDSAHGDFFQTFTTKQAQPDNQLESSEPAILKPAFDGSASWWTQGLGHGNPALALTAAHAAGRYGHVMFANAIHAPALNLAQTLLARHDNPRLQKVFYSDNGSTGVEVAVKMALRATSVKFGLSSNQTLPILGLTNSYHGDTIGTMDCSEPSIYNEKVNWYEGRGTWLDFPTVKMRNGRWLIENPYSKRASEPNGLASKHTFSSLDEIFDTELRSSEYEDYRKLLREELLPGKTFGALIIEPVLLGAGGMLFADPLFQKALVDEARHFYQKRAFDQGYLPGKLGNDALDWQGLPVIFDEVFTGLYRLGRFSAASFLDVQPDIVVNAKLLTGGLLPLCTTTASQDIFKAFLSNDKTDALLHGHSYTAHAIGCAVANHSLDILTAFDEGDTWTTFRKNWTSTARESAVTTQSNKKIWSVWSPAFVRTLSHFDNVDHVFAIGTVLAVSVKDLSGSTGYASTAATGLRDALLAGDGADSEAAVIHSRVLGNILYLMAAPSTAPTIIEDVEQLVLKGLQ